MSNSFLGAYGDASVFSHLAKCERKLQNHGYQTRINAILRSYMKTVPEPHTVREK